MQTKIQKWGNSQGIRLPKTVLKTANISVGDELVISVKDSRLIIEPAPRPKPKFKIADLVSKMPENYKSEELDWGKPEGKEEW